MKQEGSGKNEHQLFHVNFHDFVEKENSSTSMELADEFGLSLREVKQLKKKLGRN
ncbi:hypothetical protein [Alkalihalobacterium alkalinitrilicum]|uniref:hypothetical protein n=1 Tax=Alkalihalobacterium alkalinitrilicum TaxID=427920 RepID=UPI0014738536|nr:hypothetical protein [Alkalihalobacterium alkalinitrilicum]